MTVTQGNGKSRSPTGRDRSGLSLIAGAIAMIVLGWIVLFQMVRREESEAIANAARVDASLTQALGEHIRAAIKIVDMDSRQLATEIERRGIHSAALDSHLARINTTIPLVVQISVIDSHGFIVASAPAFKRSNLSEREHYRFDSRGKGHGLFIATPVRNRRTGKWTIPLTRKLLTPDGAFAGALAFELDLSYFSDYLPPAVSGKEEAITVVRSDGAVLVRRIENRSWHAAHATTLPWLAAARASRSGWGTFRSPEDGEDRVTAYSTMPDSPLIVAIGTPLRSALAPVQQRLPAYYTAAVTISAALLLAAALIVSLLHRHGRTYRSLAESDARFRSLTMLSSDWYWEQDEHFRLTMRSDVEQRKLPLAASLEVGQQRWDLPALNLSEEDWARHRALLERHESFRDFEIARSAGHGNTTWISVSGEPVFNASGKFRGYRGVVRDITVRKHNEQLFALEHSIARSLAEHESVERVMEKVIRGTCETQDWQCGRYFSADTEAGVLRFVSGWVTPGSGLEPFLAASPRFVYGRGEGVLGRAWQAGAPFWEADLARGMVSKYRAMIGPCNLHSAFSFPVLAAGEVTGVFAFVATKVREPDDQLIHTSSTLGQQVGMFLQRRRAEDEILRLNAELEHRVAERTQELQGSVKEMEAFTYTVAHDLRSPLRAINGFCRILQQDYAGSIPDEGRAYLGRVAANAGRLGLLIDDLLTFSRCSRVEMTKVTVSMESLFRQAIGEYVPGDARARVCVGAMPPCEGDPSLLRQVVANLVSNAIKYSRNEPEPYVEMGHADGAYYVRDNGVGFDMLYADKLFGVFSRLHRSDEFEGTGVGLAIVKRIVERHGGRVWAESALGRGATFFFTLA